MTDNTAQSTFGPYGNFPHVYICHSGEKPCLKRVSSKGGIINEEVVCEPAVGFEIRYELIPESTPETKGYYIHAKLDDRE
ncbi:MAG: hypothetical protein PHF67_02810 [Candidatus Nanoarchaeia archaeon]|nr:hypothetical protein [Candidatus Nanoarchaeia archaeon]